MPYEKLRSSLLAARDRRQALLDAAVATGPGAVVAVSLNIPGPVKSPRGAPGLFAEAIGRLRAALPGATERYRGRDALGPFSVWSVPGDPVSVKRVCAGIESASRRARLIDLDVYSPAGKAVDRVSLGLPQRECLACGRPARECARRLRHSVELLAWKARALLDSPEL